MDGFGFTMLAYFTDMANQNAKEFDRIIKEYPALKLKLMQQAALMALAHFKSSFTNQGFTDKNLEKWKARAGGTRNAGRSILIDKGVLRRGLRVKNVAANKGVVGVDDAIKYAKIQNEGGEIPITPKMRRFFWAMYKKNGGGIKGRRDTEQALFWKNMALHRGDTIKIPKRQFIGDSAILEEKIINYFNKELLNFFNHD
ncbi:MAG: hypothetical protein IE931_05610 [Sphingobacteriales bacterium]|nr:hypothetical protein [Sphingobacteriales bacterium]